MPTPEERIVDSFNTYFANFGIRIEPTDVVLGRRRTIQDRGWWITYRVDPDDGGFPSLEFYATHRMTNDRHHRIWADGHVDALDAIHEFVIWNPKVLGSEEAAREEFLRYNQAVAKELRAKGLYPEGDINAFLRTGRDVDRPARPKVGGDASRCCKDRLHRL